MRFWDSSALLPLLVHQPASPRADRWWADDPEIAIWTLTPTEITSAFWRLVRDGSISERDAYRADTRAQELSAASYAVVDVDLVQSQARRLLRVHPLPAADAFQLGAALVWAGNQPAGKLMHTLDERLALASRREGFEVP